MACGLALHILLNVDRYMLFLPGRLVSVESIVLKPLTREIPMMPNRTVYMNLFLGDMSKSIGLHKRGKKFFLVQKKK